MFLKDQLWFKALFLKGLDLLMSFSLYDLKKDQFLIDNFIFMHSLSFQCHKTRI
ncbi:hypothetical protein C8D91_0647 [Marinicella litoralis]|uniref:Uncharacterized protein n=1 Tax=Marinicella litoralis TaxID=644220 RepID=A0A4V3DIW5_9GAMM|nr:hypothetical protein C8D91_0647 [Marinicella litoralis]